MTDKVFLITGASSGIGEATARLAAEAGYRLVLAARSEDKLQALVVSLGGRDRALPIRCDVTEREDQERMTKEALEHFGQIDVVFANAGIGSTPGGFSGADPEHWRNMILTNVYGVGLTLQATLAELRASKGHLVLTGSAAGRRTLPGSMYSATKWAVSAIGYGVREELRGSGVRVTLLEPGMVDTPFFDEPKPEALKADDIARAVMYAVAQPHHVDMHEMLIFPTPRSND
ncbi:MAG: SDR family oxidoreductase [Gammaproteobacteria bacterium]|nr:SDR family oxidoreductase [Gammaproteobacteria bacterium]